MMFPTYLMRELQFLPGYTDSDNTSPDLKEGWRSNRVSLISQDCQTPGGVADIWQKEKGALADHVKCCFCGKMAKLNEFQDHPKTYHKVS
jgi:hypothetical protein